MDKQQLKKAAIYLKCGEYDGAHIMTGWIACDELIKAQERIAELEAELKEEKLQHGFTNISLDYSKRHLEQCEAALGDRDDKIDALRAELKSREWISVEDRLPDEEVRVSISDGVITGYGYINQYTHEFNVGATNDTVPFTAKWITHWMPLPSPPESDNAK